VDRLHEICVLAGDGLNLAGIRHVLALQEQTRRLQAELDQHKNASKNRNATTTRQHQ
jgi:DNA-binding transcriptional MerR regulator